MAPQKIAQRKRAMRVADAVNKIEGVPVRSYAIELSRQNHWCTDERSPFEKPHGDGPSREVKL